jgi:LPXTG-motif cell wall-anchored protein
MPKSRVALVALITGLLSILAAPAANAAYAPPPFTADAPSTVKPGAEFSITFDAGNVSCAPWTLSDFEGQSVPPGSGSTYIVTLTAPTEPGTYTVTAHCTWDPDAVNPASGPVADSAAVTPAVYTTSAVSSDTLLAAPQTDTYSVQIVVASAADVNDETADTGAIPDTGGSNITLLAIGAGLLVAGAGVTVAARRRKSAS